MTHQDLLQQIYARYKQCLLHCDPQTVNTPVVLEFLEVSRKYLTALPGSDNNADGDPSGAEVRIEFRNAAKILLNQAPWLETAARQALQDFIREQPEFLWGKYKFTADFFTDNIEQWEKDLGRLAGAPGLRFLEVGSFEGRSTCWLLENILTHETSEISCIDLFDFGGQGMADLRDSGLESMSIEERFDHNIELTMNRRKVKKIVSFSHDALRSPPLSHYDFIYIDGSHMALNVLEDSVLAWRLLKDDGLMTFDDYKWQGSLDPLACPKIAIDAFLQVYAGAYSLVHQDYQVTIEKLSDPYVHR